MSTKRLCMCGRQGTIYMVPPDLPTQHGNGGEGYWFCARCALDCRFLQPADAVPTGRAVQAEQEAVFGRVARGWDL